MILRRGLLFKLGFDMNWGLDCLGSELSLFRIEVWVSFLV